MSMGTPIDRVIGRGFGITRGSRAGDNLAKNNSGGQVKTVLSDAEGTKQDMD